MRFLNSRIAFVFFFVFALSINAHAQTDKRFLETQAVKDEVARALQTRDVTELSNELAQQKSTQTRELLKKLIVFSRAGHRARVLETFHQLIAAKDFEVYKSYLFHPMQEAAGKDDLAARKFFYEHIALGGDENVESFIELWRKNGDGRELEKWLAARARLNFSWWQEFVRLKQSLGTVEEAYAQLEREIRANPKNWQLIEWYLRSVDSNRNIAWLAEIVPTDLAWEAYELANYLSRREPQIAAKLFEKSLLLPFTEKDAEKFWWHITRSFSMMPKIKNPEKQLRFWTKKALAEVYRKTNQPQLAQPLVEELAATDMSDILKDEVFGLAGTVQAASGQRVVEAKILQEEAQKQDSPQYWEERAQYYMGRREKEAVWQTLVQVLEKFPYKPGDAEASKKRLQIMNLVRWYGVNVEKRQPEEVFRREFAQAAKDGNYLFEIGRIIGDDFEDLLEEFFFNNERLLRILAVRPKWRDQERALIADVMVTDEWEPAKREQIWGELMALAKRDLRNRAFTLAEAMTHRSQHKRAITLLEELLKTAPEDFQGDLNYNREYVQKELFDAYLAINDWRSAEKMFFGGFDYWKDGLGKIALASARNGDTSDAVRLWKMNANRDRQNLWHLEELAKTDVKAALREFYLEMKERDPLTDVPDKALRILQ